MPLEIKSGETPHPPIEPHLTQSAGIEAESSKILSTPGFEPPKITCIHWARKLMFEKIAVWTDALNQAGLKDFEILPRGAVYCGHFVGPKPSKNTYSPRVPESFEKIVEVDLRIVLAKGQDPRDPQIVSLIQKTLGTQEIFADWNNEPNEWGMAVPNSYLYRYDPIQGLNGEPVGLEWEIGIYSKPLVPIELFWDNIFEEYEIRSQTEVRQALHAAKADYKEIIWPAKDAQCREGAWRVVAGFALAHISRANNGILDSIIPPFFLKNEPDPDIVAPRVALWLNGESGLVGVDRPNGYPEEAKNILSKLTDKLLVHPAPPRWVQIAAEIQDALRSGR